MREGGWAAVGAILDDRAKCFFSDTGFWGRGLCDGRGWIGLPFGDWLYGVRISEVEITLRRLGGCRKELGGGWMEIERPLTTCFWTKMSATNEHAPYTGTCEQTVRLTSLSDARTHVRRRSGPWTSPIHEHARTYNHIKGLRVKIYNPEANGKKRTLTSMTVRRRASSAAFGLFSDCTAPHSRRSLVESLRRHIIIARNR